MRHTLLEMMAMEHSFAEAHEKLDAIYRRGASALENMYVPGNALHVGIDWQKFYCDPTFPLSHCQTFKISFTQKIHATMARMNEFVQALRPHLPSAWVYHDFPVRKDFKDDLATLYGVEGSEATERKFQEWKAQANQICAATAPSEPLFPKEDFNAYSNPDLVEHSKSKGYHIQLLTGLIRSHCLRESEYHGHLCRFNMFVIDDLTVDGYAYGGPAHLQVAKDADSRGTYLVRSEDASNVIAKAHGLAL
ncbi:MAG: hypothetical protein ACK4NR_11175 [Micavibrio sp.]